MIEAVIAEVLEHLKRSPQIAAPIASRSPLDILIARRRDRTIGEAPAGSPGRTRCFRIESRRS